ncbi:hypothetical protein BDZ45DRAFT_750847 [Acephala macrosclerotiorum]|nr:hypothetical protein BDZ45DRAFT_750847 [Acephala macrosclerotiorum]
MHCFVCIIQDFINYIISQIRKMCQDFLHQFDCGHYEHNFIDCEAATLTSGSMVMSTSCDIFKSTVPKSGKCPQCLEFIKHEEERLKEEKKRAKKEAARKAFEELESAFDFKPPTSDIITGAVAYCVLITFEYRPRKKEEPHVPEAFVKRMLGDCAATQIDVLLAKRSWHHLDAFKLKRTAEKHVADLC